MPPPQVLFQEIRPWISWESVAAISTAVAAVGTTVAAIATAIYARYTKRLVEETKRASVAAVHSAVAAKSSAAASEIQARSAEKTVEVMLKQLEDTKRAADASVESALAAKQSAALASVGLESQRAWVLVDDYSAGVVHDPQSKKTTIQFFVTLKNWGLTPAVNVTFVQEWSVGEGFPIPDPRCTKTDYPAVLGPGDAKKFGGVCTVEDPSFDENGTRMYFICGYAEYRDVFKPDTPRRTPWCFSKRQRSTSFTKHLQGNEPT